MSVARDIQELLQDDTIEITKRIMLAESFANTQRPNFPEKNQIVIDWICTSIVTSDEDVVNNVEIWHLFHTLICKKDEQLTKFSNSFFDAICKGLAQINKSGEEISLHIISILQESLKNTRFLSTLNFKTAIYIHLLSVTMQTVAEMQLRSLAHRENAMTVLSELLNLSKEICGKELNQEWVFDTACEEILKPAAFFHVAFSYRAEVTYQESDLYSNFKKTIEDLFFNFSHVPSYDGMIKHLFKDAKTMNKNMTNFISCLKQLCSQTIVSTAGTATRDPCCVLILLYKGFLDKYQSRFAILDKVRFLLIMLGINGLGSLAEQNSIVNSNLLPSAQRSDCEMLIIMRDLLLTLSAKQANLSVAVGSDPSVLNLYKSMRGMLLNQIATRPVPWFESLDALLDVNVTILRTTLKKLLLESWIDVKHELSAAEENAQVKFICHLVSIYVKLFQLPDFIEVILKAYSDSSFSDSKPFKLSIDVVQAFRKGFQELPCGQILKLWKMLVNSVIELIHSTPPLKTRDSYLQLSVSLLHSLIRHTRLLELTMTPADGQLLEELLNLSFDKCMPCVLDLSLSSEDPSIVGLYFTLSQAFGDFILLVANYCPNYSAKISSQMMHLKTKRSYWDVECLHFYTKADMWKRMFATVRSAKRPKLNYLASQLVLQKVEACVSFGDEVCAENAANSAIKYLSKLVSFCNHPITQWNNEAEDVNDGNVDVAIWTLIAVHLKQLVSHCSENELNTIANMILDVISKQSDNAEVPSRRICPFAKAEVLMSWDEITELSSLQTALVTTVMQKCLVLFSTQSDCEESLMQILCSNPNNWLQFGNTVPFRKDGEPQNELWESVKAAGSILCETMKGVLHLDSHIDCTKLLSLLRVLELLPLQHLLPGNNIRLVYFVIGTISRLPTFQDVEMRIEIAQRCQKIFLCILDGQRQQLLFNFVRSGDIIDWMLRTFPKIIPANATINSHLLEEFQVSSALLIDKTVKLALQINKHFKDLNDCVTKFSRESPETTTWLHLTFAVAVLDGLKHTVKRFTGVPTKMLLAKKYFETLQDVVLVYAERLTEKRLSESSGYQSLKMKGVLFKGFAVILDHKCEAEPQTVSTLGNCLPIILKEALDVTESETLSIPNYRDNSNWDLIHVSVANYDKLEEFLPKKFMLLVWRKVNELWPKQKRELTEAIEVKEKSLNRLLQVICTNCSAQQFQKHILTELLGGLTCSEPDYEKIYVSISIWLIILKMQLDDEKWEIMKCSVSEVFLLSGDLLATIFGTDLTESKMNVAVHLLKLVVAMLASFQNDLSIHQLDLCLHTCMCCHLNKLEDLNAFYIFFNNIYEVCNSILKYHWLAAQNVVPSLASFIQYILSEMMKRSYQEQLQQNSNNVEIMHKCAMNMERLFTLMSTQKGNFVSGVVHIIAKYVNELSKATLMPIVKTTLTIGMQRLMAMCNRDGLVLLRCNLKSGSKELFTHLHEDFIKYHKYQGKI